MTADVRFEISINGQRLCVTGVEGYAVLSQSLHYVLHDPKEFPDATEPELGFSVTGLDDIGHMTWSLPEVKLGDEITIRILGPGEFDRPERAMHVVQYDDPVFGSMKSNGHYWITEVDVPSAAGHQRKIRLNVSGDSNGIDQFQRDKFRTLLQNWSAVLEESQREIEMAIPRLEIIDFESEPSILILCKREKRDDADGDWVLVYLARDWSNSQTPRTPRRSRESLNVIFCDGKITNVLRMQ